MRPLFAVLMTLVSAAPALGAATEWFELAPGTRIRLVASEAWSAEGRTLVAIELDMPANTKTYWRVPGESGIPMELDFEGSSGIDDHRLIWPYPQIERKNGYTDFVYYGPTVIPVELSVGSSVPLVNVSVLLGVCSDICVPATAEFSLPLDIGDPDMGQDIRIAQAMALAPLPWTVGAEPIGDVNLAPGGEELRIAVDPAIVDPASVIADASAAGYLAGAPQKSPEPDIVVLPLLGGDDGSRLDAKPIELIFMTREGPFVVSRQIAP